MRNNKGVTLVALVITIIVLLILAGVSLAMLTGDSGILTNAENAKSETAIANAEDAIKMAYMDIKTEVYAINAGASSLEEMTGAQMETIAKRYITEVAGKVELTPNGPAEEEEVITLQIKYVTEGIDKTITYNPSASPVVSLDDTPAED